MGVRDEGVYVGLMVRKERVDVRLVEEARALGLRENEVGEKKETDIGVEWEPKTRVSGEQAWKGGVFLDASKGTRWRRN